MNIFRSLKIMYMLFKMKLSKNMAFRFSFFGAFFVDGSLFLIQILMFSAIYNQVESIGGWGREQMLIFIGTFSLINALNMTLYFFGLLSIPGKIQSGELDLYITKPINTLFHLSFESIDVGSIPLVFASLGIIIYGAAQLNTSISFMTVIGYAFLVIIMLLLYYDMMVLIRTIPFFTIKISSLERLEGELIILCFKIPGTLFKGAFKILFYLILPYGIMATVPTQFFVGTLTPLGFIYSLAIVAIFTIFAYKFWSFGLKSYKSASS